MCIEELKAILSRVCANPSNPTFNHYLFETIASLVRYICAATPAAVDAFEAMLFPPFQQVLANDIAEFTPYVLQVLAQLLEARTGLSPSYVTLFPPLLMPAMWERPGNIPALVRLLCAYMAKGKAQVRDARSHRPASRAPRRLTREVMKTNRSLDSFLLNRMIDRSGAF